MVFIVGFLLLCAAAGRSEGAATVHVIPHSHCDPGYRKTFEAYFTADVKSILDSLLVALQDDPSKRFVWEEVSFLSRWWEQASEQQKETMRKLHAAGQLEFIGGGWVMHDEADTSLRGILNQMTEGLVFLNKTLGVRPRIGWHIDPFGHSSFTPQLFSLLHYDMFVLNRIPDSIKQDMKQSRGLEFLWHNPHFNRTIFAHVLDSHYSTPVIFAATVEERAKSLVSTCQKRLQWYKTDNLLLPFGNDFHFQHAPSDFKEMDEILKYVADHPNDFDDIVIHYSTLSEYFESVSKSGVSFDQREDDFFPYIACSPCFSRACEGFEGVVTVPCGISDSYWSGFYTSKPSQKHLLRELEASLHALEQINALYPNLTMILADDLNLARNTSALLQHHDAITGTSFPACYTDYNQRLEKALHVVDTAIATLKSSVLCGRNSGKVPALQTDSVAVLKGLTETNRAVIVVQNTLETPRDTYIRISLPNNLCVKALSGSQELTSQQVAGVLYVPVHLQPMALQVVWLEKTPCQTNQLSSHFNIPVGESVEISNKDLRLQFNESGHLSGWTQLSTGVTHQLSHSYLQEAEKENLNEENVCDGTNVYTFVPDNGATVLTPKSIPITVTASGPLIWEVQQQINPYINTTWRLLAPFSNSSNSSGIFSIFAEWQTTVGPLPSEPHNSVLSRLLTETNAKSFTTYASGYYPVMRSYRSEDPLQANTYPLVGRAVFPQATGGDLAVVTLRPMALSSDGQALNLMLHRRIKLLLDKRGDDSTVMDDPILMGFIPNNSSGVLTASVMREHRNPPTLHFALVNSTTNWTSQCLSQWLPAQSLPQSVQSHSVRLLKLISSTQIEVGIRLMNVDESQSHEVDIGGVFREWSLLEWTETTPDFLQSTSLTQPRTNTVSLSPLELKCLVLHLQKN